MLVMELLYDNKQNDKLQVAVILMTAYHHKTLSLSIVVQELI